MSGWVNNYPGVPPLSVFSNNLGQGSPLCVDTTTGKLYYLFPNNIIAPVGSQDGVNILDFGGIGDGVTDNHFALAAAILAGRGGKVLIPYGNFLVNTDAGPIIAEEVNIVGVGVRDGATSTIDRGSNLWITGTTNSLFKVRRGTSFDSLGFYYPNQVNSATPVVYPWTLDFDFTNGAVQFVNVQNCVVYNAYNFCQMDNAGGGVGHCWFLNNTIYAINTIFSVTYNAETLHFNGNDFTFGHWLAATEAGCRGFTRANGTVLKIAQSDGIFWNGNLCFGYLNGWLTSATGNCQLMKYGSNNAMDQVRYGINATGSGNISVSIDGGNDWICFNSQDTTQQGNAIRITTTGTARETITIAPQDFAEASEDMIYVSGNIPSRDIIVATCNFLSWATGKTVGFFAALSINGSNTTLEVSGGIAVGGNNTPHSYAITGSFNELICNNFKAESCQRVLSVSVTTLTGSANLSTATGDTISDVYSAGTRIWGPNNFDKPQDKSPMATTVSLYGNYASDALAAAGGISIGGWYRNGNVMQMRVV